MDQIWIQVDIYTSTAGLEPLGAALADIGHPAFSVTDAADFAGFLENKEKSWDYIDDSLMRLRDTETTVIVYLPDNRQGRDSLSAIEGMLARLKALDTAGEWGRLEYSLSDVKEEDWAVSWKKHYKPFTVGERLMICPSWEIAENPENRAVMRLDPGMAFGTGTHETTRLCLEALESVISPGDKILDVGCGSGILAIGALLLGAGFARGIDIDQVAVKTARENAQLNAVQDRSQFFCGELAQFAEGKYDIICANIVADVILELLPQIPRLLTPRGRIIISGIITDRARDVHAAAENLGFTVTEQREDNGWCAAIAGFRI
ncbi:MAG: 50S ribosomal protein L11 methyltransferase [Oscillospiraceae bacterium]|nr:50S ribosomal protein L11 methyltransferase [Oscillospiraceae bacterium]